MPIASIVSFVDILAMLKRVKRSAISNGFLPGCGAMPMFSISSDGFANTMTSFRAENTKPVSMDSTCTACMPPLRPCSAILQKSIQKQVDAARNRYACFEHFAEDAQRY